MAGKAISIAILANARGALAEIKRTSDAAGKLETKAKGGLGLGKTAVLGAAAAGVGLLGVALKQGVDEASRFQDAGNAANSALKTNASLANLSVAAIQKNSAALEGLTGSKIDENDITLAGNQLIRAGVAGQGNYTRALQDAADVASAKGKDIAGVSIALSKALANPAKASGALGRAGVSLTAVQQNAIQAMAKTGNVAGAQSMLLGILESKYRGAAAAAGQGFAGQLGNAQDAISDAKRDLTIALLPALSKVAAAFAKNLPGAIAKVTPVLNRVITIVTNPAFLKFAAVVLGIVVAFKAYTLVAKAFEAERLLVKAATAAWTAAQWLLDAAMTANPIGLLIVAIVALVAVVVVIATKTTWFQTIWRVTVGAIKTAAVAVFNFLKGYFLAIFTVYKTIFLTYVAVFKAIWSGLAWLITKTGAVFGAIKSAISAAIGWITGKIGAFVAGARKVWAGITAMVTLAVDVKNRIIAVFQGWLNWMAALPGKVVDGLVAGLKAAWTKVTDFIRDAVNEIPGTVKTVLGIGSPSKVMAELGGHIGAGLVNGIASQVPALARQMAVVSDTVSGGVTAQASVALGTTGSAQVTAAAGAGAVYNLTVNVPPTSDPAQIGRAVVGAIEALERITGRQRLISA
jgi:phage-related protein